MSVQYKFKSNLDYDTVTFHGLSISVADLKKSIMQQKKIGTSSDCDLQITNAQTEEVYDNDEMLIPNNTSVIVARVPVAAGRKKNWNKQDLPLPIKDDHLGQIRYDKLVKISDLVNVNTTEEDKAKSMITQSNVENDPSKSQKSQSKSRPPPPFYKCYRCGIQGHWIKNCPTNNHNVKRSTGIPRSFMVLVDGPEHKGALLTSSGYYAVPLIAHEYHRTDEQQDSQYQIEYENHRAHSEESTGQHAERYHIASYPDALPATVPVYPVSAMPVAPIITAEQVFAPQPPPPDASPVDTIAAYQPPPGAGPVIPPAVTNDPQSFNNQLYDYNYSQKDVKQIDTRSINDKLKAFQRELNKRNREYSRDLGSCSRSSSDRERPRTSPCSRTHISSKSLSRSVSPSARTSRSRSRSPLYNQSCSRSYSHSRSRSWSKSRSCSRSHSRTRTESSRSQSRSRTKPRFKRIITSRDRIRSRMRSRSRSCTPKNYRHRSHKDVSYSGRHSYIPPEYETSYQYGTPPAVAIPVVHPEYPSHHLSSIYPTNQSLLSKPTDHYVDDEEPPYSKMCNMYDLYKHLRYEQEQRAPSYEKRQRVVNTSSSKSFDMVKETRDKIFERSEQSPKRESSSNKQPSSRDRRDRTYSSRRLERDREIRYNVESLRKEKRYRFASEKYGRSSPDYNSRDIEDRRKPYSEGSLQSRNVRHHTKESVQEFDRSWRNKNTKRSRSRS